jgi:hypothetical protein
MNVPDFLSPRLVGKRFDGHSIPLEILGDLAVLEAMIIEVAKWRYLQENKDRKRSPRNFTDGITLTLTAVGNGSAIAKIALALAVNSLIPTPQQDFMEQARDAIVGAIAAAGENKSPTKYLPIKALTYFDRLGRSLLDDEAIEFSSPSHLEPARLTRETRLRLLQAAEVTERTEEIHLRGAIFDFNKDEMTFKLMLPDGIKVDGPVGRQHFETFSEAHYGYEKGLKVLLEGVGKYNRANRLQKIESVEHVTLLDPLDFPSQLEELKLLKDGWYDGKGHAPTAAGLDWLAEAMNQRYPESLTLPYVYPVAEGGVRLEWTMGSREISLEINVESRIGEWHCLNLETDGEEAQNLNLDSGTDWEWIVVRLQAFGGTAS